MVDKELESSLHELGTSRSVYGAAWLASSARRGGSRLLAQAGFISV